MKRGIFNILMQICISLFCIFSCEKVNIATIEIQDCKEDYSEPTKDSLTKLWNKTNAQVVVANCLYEKYFVTKNEKYKNEVLKLAKVINANIEIYHDTISEKNFIYVKENEIWKPKYPYKFYLQAYE
ncbi:hypothetical protein J8J42_06630 [Chryseobacterium sp. cx-311]|uniref:hypothetical protein n=1 Tax=Weeksellaceae TaxID=2762318 RepID=UPI001AEAB362|nr:MULTISPECIES: hypothetical protein [Weeksellaceae]MBP0612717.1 hypothetical protein [Marnyiella aurantia]MDF0719863.1 hypothetical protein [Kaistella sp. PBT33-4]